MANTRHPYDRECCYAEMSPIRRERAEDSEQRLDDVPYQNAFERLRPGSDGLDQSGMK